VASALLGFATTSVTCSSLSRSASCSSCSSAWPRSSSAVPLCQPALDFSTLGCAADELFAPFGGGFGCTVGAPMLTSAAAFSAAFGTARVAVQASSRAPASRLAHGTVDGSRFHCLAQWLVPSERDDLVPDVVLADRLLRPGSLHFLERLRVDHDQRAVHLPQAGQRVAAVLE
jgi:hypothetical protein